MIPEQGGVENNFNYNYLLVQTILKMRDAQADDQPARYWTYFEYALGLVISHLDFQLKGEIQQDYAILMAAFRKINLLKDTELNAQSKKSLINKLKEDFADAHRFYIMQALNRVGIVKVEDEGIINFESTDLDTMTKIVRDLPNGTIASFEKQDGKKTPPIIKPEMVLVTYKDKLIEMPKEDFLKMQAAKQEEELAPIVSGEMPEEEPQAEDDDLELESESEDAEAKEGTPKNDTAVETEGNHSANPASKQFGWKRKYEI
jgi:hypothetical protein